MLVLALAVAPQAAARGGHYAFDGATPYQQDQVRKALEASAFDWSLVPWTVVVHVSTLPQIAHAQRGGIWIRPEVLAQGKFAWGVVQHEYAHQVDYALLSEADHANLLPVLGGKVWQHVTTDYGHSEFGCERFASTLAWSYWPDRSNLTPHGPNDEGGAMAPEAFRTMLRTLLVSRGIAAAAALPTKLPG